MDAYLIFVCTLSLCIIAASKEIKIQTGEVVGNVKSVSIDGISHNVYEYLGIPYAKAPVDELRFRKPEPLTRLESPFNATEFGAVCPQTVTGILSDAEWKQSEDCLSVNVFVPERSLDNATDLAVMVWVHGGGFTEGSAITYDGKFVAAFGNVIVVTFNYRLGVFGYISTNDETARGNFGLWDQKMAFQWVHDNIEYFGGDNNRVTIFGESAGAVSCMAHGLIPENYGLFQRVIAESGSPTIPGFEWPPGSLQNTRVIADQVDCNHEATEKMIECLRTKSWQDILAATGRMSLMPVVDGDLISKDPSSLIELSKTTELEEISFYRSLDILNGFNTYDGLLMLYFSSITNPGQIEYFQPTKEMQAGMFRSIYTSLLGRNVSDELLKMIDAEYTTWHDVRNSHEIRLNIVKLLTDLSFGVPAVEMAHLHKASAASARHYMYFFTPKPPVRILPAPSWINGAGHTDEIPFVFGIEHDVPNLDANSWEVQLSRNMIKYWTNFAKTGNPNSPVAVSPAWPEYNLESQHYMKLEEVLTESSVQQYLNAREANFWLNVFPDVEQALQKDKPNGHCPVSSATRASFNVSVTFYAVCVFLVSAVLKHNISV